MEKQPLKNHKFLHLKVYFETDSEDTSDTFNKTKETMDFWQDHFRLTLAKNQNPKANEKTIFVSKPQFDNLGRLHSQNDASTVPFDFIEVKIEKCPNPWAQPADGHLKCILYEVLIPYEGADKRKLIPWNTVYTSLVIGYDIGHGEEFSPPEPQGRLLVKFAFI